MIDPIYPGIPYPNLIECFLLYCVQDAFRKIEPKTADQYVSAMLKYREHKTGDYDLRNTPGVGIRSALYIAVYKSLEQSRVSKTPLRLRARIPFTLPFVSWSLQFILDQYPDPQLQRVLQAAFAAGHAFSLRPGEYLASSHKYESNRYLNAYSTFAWFNGVPFNATDCINWPNGNPTHISSTLDVRKNSSDQGGPVAVAANPLFQNDRTVFCAVNVLTQYIRHANLQRGDPLFVYQGTHLTTEIMSHIMKSCAEHHDLDPDRVVPACLRKNVITQMDLNVPQLQRQLQGGWRSSAGEDYYWSRLLQVADSNQQAVHTVGSATIDIIRNIFATAIPPSS
jgi:hypothetical protein